MLVHQSAIAANPLQDMLTAVNSMVAWSTVSAAANELAAVKIL